MAGITLPAPPGGWYTDDADGGLQTQVIIGELRTGRNLVYIPASGISKLTWSVSRNTPDDVKVTFNLNDDDTYALGLAEAGTPAASFLVVVIGDVPIAGGPVWIQNATADDNRLTMTAKGMWSYFDHRVLLPLIAETTPIINPATGEPYAVMDVTYVGWAYGTIAKRLVQQALAFTGGHVPIVFPADEPAAVEKTYLGTDLGMVGERLRQLTDLQDGPDIAFIPRWTDDRLGIEWHLVTGTMDQPNIVGDVEHVFDYSVPEPSIAGLEVTVDASNLSSREWVNGGRSDDRTYIERADYSTLLAAGYPLMESVSNSDAETPEFLRSEAAESVRINRQPKSQWAFKFRADGDPGLADVAVGDYARIITGPRTRVVPVSGPEGHRRRLAGLAGDEVGRWITATVMESYG